MEKHVAILNNKADALVREIKNPDANFAELIRQILRNPKAEEKELAQRVNSYLDSNESTPQVVLNYQNGQTRTAGLEDKVADYLETRTLEHDYTPRKYKCVELQLKQKIPFGQYCKNTSCIVVNREIYTVDRSKEQSVGTLKLFGDTFYIQEKDRDLEIEIPEELLSDLLRKNYFNYRGSLYELEETNGEIELKGKKYRITDRKMGAMDLIPGQQLDLDAPANPTSVEITYRQTSEVRIRRTYK